MRTFTISTWLLSRITKVTLLIVVGATYVARMKGHTIGFGLWFIVEEHNAPIVGADSTIYTAKR